MKHTRNMNMKKIGTFEAIVNQLIGRVSSIESQREEIKAIRELGKLQDRLSKHYKTSPRKNRTPSLV